MGLIKCNQCGEMYADSYKTCPFCAEDEEYYNGRVKKRSRRPTEKRVKRPSAKGPLLFFAALLVVAVLVWAVFGKHIGGADTAEDSDVEPIGQEDVVQEGMTLDSSALQLAVGESRTLQVIGAEDSVSWASSDPAVASVTESGTVTGVAEGSAMITAACGEETASCSVTVGEDTAQESTDTPTNDEDTEKSEESGSTTGKVDLSKLQLNVPAYGTTLQKNSEGGYDVTMRKGESFQLEVSGVSGNVTWSSSNSAVVTVDSEGTLTRVASGEATVTGKIGTASFSILIR